jgi:pimeloyl-ACP methyl ester carboxylesterase
MLFFRLFLINYMPYTGKVRVLETYPDDSADQLQTVDQVPPQNDLQTAWNENDKHYEKKSGGIEVGGKPYEFKVSFIELGHQRRAITEVAPDLDKRHDIVIPVLPGWGETSAQFEGDFLEILLEVLKEAGYENPKIIGVNVSGRGTPEYVQDENRARISSIGLMDEITDAADIADVLAGHGHFGNRGQKPSVAVIGHSMGALNASAFMDVLNKGGDHKVDKLLQMMPAVDGPFAMMRAKFLWAVRKQVITATQQAFTGKGALELGVEDYHRIMFGDKHFRDPEQFARSLPDSSRRFLELTLNRKRRFEDVYKPGGTADGVKMTVWQGGKDSLIPDSAIDDLSFLVGDGGLNDVVNIRVLPMISHSLPFRLRDEQMIDVKSALESWIA